MKQKRPISEMLPVALALVDRLAPACTRIALAGSIRRGAALVGDVEIVCQPAGEALETLCADLLRLRQIQQRTRGDGQRLAWGARYKAMLFEGVPVDLFIVLPDRQWGPTYLIRTGPGEANDSLVTLRERRNQQGRWGILPAGMAFRDGAVLRDRVALDVPEEADVFRAVGLPYVPPPLRSYQTYRGLTMRRGLKSHPPEWADGQDDYFVAGERRMMAAAVAVTVPDVAPLEQRRLF